MAQILFGSDTSCANGDLDANFTELYSKTAWSATGIGYPVGAGSGSSVTQLTSKSTAVTINKLTGRIVMDAASLAAGAQVGFICNNTTVLATDVVAANIFVNGSVDMLNYRLRWGSLANQIVFVLENVSGAARAEAVSINFVVLRGSTT